MEQILWLYSKPLDPKNPVLCFDERPCFLIGDTIAPLPVKKGSIRKVNYSYEKFGSCALLAAIEPLTGQRIANVYHQRRKREYALFMKELADMYPDAEKIHLVQDNLNTHDISAFYEVFSPDEAFQLAQRFQFYFTPKSASWLNMIEIEFSAIARQCLNRRIAVFETLKSEVLACFKERTEKRIKIDWQFSIQTAREKFSRHYVNLKNV